MQRHACRPPTPLMGGVNDFHIRILDGVGNRDSIVHTNTANLHMQVFPVAVDVWTYLAAAILVPGIDTIPQLYKYGIFRRNTGYEGARKYPRECKVEFMWVQVVTGWRCYIIGV